MLNQTQITLYYPNEVFFGWLAMWCIAGLLCYVVVQSIYLAKGYTEKPNIALPILSCAVIGPLALSLVPIVVGTPDYDTFIKGIANEIDEKHR